MSAGEFIPTNNDMGTNAVNSLEFMDRAVSLREVLNVTVLNQIEVKYYKLLVVLFGNPFIDAMESKKDRITVFPFFHRI